MSRLAPLLLTFALVVGGCSANGEIKAGRGGGRTLGFPPDTQRNDDDDATDEVPLPPLVTGLDLVRVTINQGAQLTLLEGELLGEPPLVAGRAALLRIHVRPQDSWEPRPVRAALVWGDETSPLTAELTPTGGSTDGDLDSTFNFELPADALRPDGVWAVRLEELDGGSGPGTDTFAAWPVDGLQPLSVAQTGTLKVHVIPVRYEADGSDRLPDTSPEQLLLLEDWLLRTYPVAEVSITVDAQPFELGYPVWSNGVNWGDLLYDMTGERQSRGIPDDTYVYGLFRPTTTPSEYCFGGCFSGLSWRADEDDDPFARVSVGLGYGGVDAALTMIHEIGHAHGRRHAPCFASNPDDDYPYPEGELGVQGWDLFSGELKDPVENRDFMGYCSPRWVSDYTWTALHTRSRVVNAATDSEPRGAETWRILAVAGDGSLRSRRTLRLRHAPAGAPWSVRWLDAEGAPLGEVEGRFRPWEHGAGGTLLVPEPPTEVAALLIGEAVVPL